MRIAFIDYISNGSTHSQFNLNQINSLSNCHLTVYLTYDSTLVDVLKEKKKCKINKFPKKKSKNKNKTTLINRIIKLNKTLISQKYDIIFFLRIDELSYFFLRNQLKQKSWVFLHNNTRKIVLNLFRRFLFKFSIGKSGILVLNNFSKESLSNLLSTKVRTIEHGCSTVFPKYKIKDLIFVPLRSNLDMQAYVNFFKRIVVRKYYNKSIYVRDKELHLELHKYEIKTTLIDNYLSEKEYKKFISKSIFLPLFFSDTFNFRLSNTLHECAYNGLPVILCSKNERNFSEYRNLNNVLIINKIESIQLEKIKNISDINYSNDLPSSNLKEKLL